jgi:hypothetical protein
MLGHNIRCSSSVPFPAARNSRFQELVVLLEAGIFLWMLGNAPPEAQKSTRKCSSGSCEILSGDLTFGRNEYLFDSCSILAAGKSASQRLLPEARNQFPDISTSGNKESVFWYIYLRKLGNIFLVVLAVPGMDELPSSMRAFSSSQGACHIKNTKIIEKYRNNVD